MHDVRPSPISGTWYPGKSATLSQTIDKLLEEVPSYSPAGEIIGLVVPHAGHRYSGRVAAHAFACIRETMPEIVAVVAPLHVPAGGRVHTSGHSAYATPLGQVPVDQAIQASFEEALVRHGNLQADRIRNDQEHALEIELPFLQRALETEFHLLPILVADQSRAVAEAIGKALAEVLSSSSALVVASSDLSHFFPDARARTLDKAMLARIKSMDPVAVMQAEEKGAGFACGRGAIAAMLWAAQEMGANGVDVLCYANSGDVTGDYGSVVGYGSAVIYRRLA